MRAGLSPRFDWDDDGDGLNMCVVTSRAFEQEELTTAYDTFDPDWREDNPFETISPLIIFRAEPEV